MTVKAAKPTLGAVVEFRFPGYFVYGVCIEADPKHGDSLAMYAETFPAPVEDLAALQGRPLRCKIHFFVAHARLRRFADILRVAGVTEPALLPRMDRRFRLDVSGLAGTPRWHILTGQEREVVECLTKETALLSDSAMPNMAAIQTLYGQDLYPWSASQLRGGPLDFDPVAFEAEMRAALARGETPGGPRPALSYLRQIARLWRG